MNSDDEILKSRITALTRDLILIPSTENRPQERERCFEHLHHHLESLPEISIEYFESHGHRSLVAKPRSVGKPEILLCGHIDVVEHPHEDCYHSRIEEGRIIGPGAGDMKGQIAILMELFCNLHVTHPGISVGMAITSDEERGGFDGVRYLCEEIGLRCGIAIIPDGGSLNDITIEEKGVLHARLSCTGREAHGARPWLGENALEKLLLNLTAVRNEFDQFWPAEPIEEQVNHWFPTCCITICKTENSTNNCIPASASAVVDIRFPPPDSVESIIRKLNGLLDSDCHLEPLMTAEPTQLEPDPLFCRVTEAITGQPVNYVRASGGSDGRFFRQYGIPINLSRPLVGNLHAENEWIYINSMAAYYRICEEYIRQKLLT